MNYFVLLLLTVFLTSVNGKTNGDAVWPQVYLLGDGFVEKCFSMKSPWCAMMANHLVKVADVVNRGANSYNSRSYLDILSEAMTESVAKNIGVLVIFLGTIDSYDVKVSPAFNVPLPEYRANIRKIIQECNDHGIGSDRIIVVTGPPAITSQKKLRSPQSALLYANASIEVANELFADWLDLRSRMMKDIKEPSDRDALFDKDGLFNFNGALYFFKFLFPHVEIKLKQFIEMELNKKFPMSP